MMIYLFLLQIFGWFYYPFSFVSSTNSLPPCEFLTVAMKDSTTLACLDRMDYTGEFYIFTNDFDTTGLKCLTDLGIRICSTSQRELYRYPIEVLWKKNETDIIFSFFERVSNDIVSLKMEKINSNIVIGGRSCGTL